MNTGGRALNLLGVSGSLRAASTNTALLRAAAAAAPDGVSFRVYEGIGDLPIFNPDLDPNASLPVQSLIRSVTEADGLVFASPEYARGVPGGLKNALDWLVGGDAFPGKRVALFRASARAVAAPAALVETLRTMSAVLVPEADVLVPLLGNGGEATAAILALPSSRAAVRAAVAAFARAIADSRPFEPEGAIPR